ncbi:MAG: hypothetical protein A3F73_11245 [Gallionellales bacterium RIFCSPLOWO2_12_FULL_59_22]|nr:MAG: hypothetical protein A3H99_10910 [Gallionellales bacterium RIFCSPLOWO2_02_FULL_59_110]OGT04665.1 MAG: hypothetical protein A2Z65_05125 [Gallionellales bacterium RIFCSPLOWO2_02_58_13]OGT11854.1 MAG: hypothetical protein A3F73_11245 [Gallionellales bacterium RIFCSPLOWO2_12_FULL_59_22]
MSRQVSGTRGITLAGLALTFLAGTMPVAAQTVPFSLEGPLSSVAPNQNLMVVMKARVTVPPGTPITTPTRELTGLSDLVGKPLPGRVDALGAPIPGFLKGTAIINGTINDLTGELVATDVFAEPAENVTIGTITQANCTTPRCIGPGSIIRINGTLMRPLGDPRIAAGPVTNEFGFPVDLTGLVVNPLLGPSGITGEAEGYFDGLVFRYFLLSVGAGAAPLLNANVAEVSVTRAQCRQRAGGIELSVLGNTHPDNGGLVTITNGGTTFGTVNTITTGIVGFGTYTFDLGGNPSFAVCPANVTAEFGGATASSAVNIIIDPVLAAP